MAETLSHFGTVSYKGKPIEGAEVTFTNKAGTSTGVGKTDSAGKFHLTTYTEKDGVVAGPQIVSIRRVDVIDKTPKDVDVSAGGVALPPEIKWIIPEKYSIPAKSGLTADVKETGANDFNSICNSGAAKGNALCSTAVLLSRPDSD